MKITRVHADRYSQQELEKLDIALELFSNAVNSVTFRDTLMNHETFSTEEGLSNLQIYNRIMQGDEVDTDEGADEEADLDLTLDLRNSTDAIGYTQRNRIFTFRNLFHQLLPTKLAGHYAHEFCHTLGFSDPDDLSDISMNVPYEIGRIVEEIAIDSHRVFVVNEVVTSIEMHSFRNASLIRRGDVPVFLPNAATFEVNPVQKKKRPVRKSRKRKVAKKPVRVPARKTARKKAPARRKPVKRKVRI